MIFHLYDTLVHFLCNCKMGLNSLLHRELNNLKVKPMKSYYPDISNLIVFDSIAILYAISTVILFVDIIVIYTCWG